jgi:hypothetical protein
VPTIKGVERIVTSKNRKSATRADLVCLEERQTGKDYAFVPPHSGKKKTGMTCSGGKFQGSKMWGNELAACFND